MNRTHIWLDRKTKNSLTLLCAELYSKGKFKRNSYNECLKHIIKEYREKIIEAGEN